MLAAASALMVLWYGGDAFSRSRIDADAARLVNEGAQIEKAEGLYRAHEGRVPSSANASDPIQALVDRHYIVHPPIGDTGKWVMDYGNGMIRADVGSSEDTRAIDVCRAARRAQRLPDPRQVYRCDGSDYPRAHPPGTLPAIEPCCSWSGESIGSFPSGDPLEVPQAK